MSAASKTPFVFVVNPYCALMNAPTCAGYTSYTSLLSSFRVHIGAHLGTHPLTEKAEETITTGEPGEAGLGLFSTRDREAWTLVDEYLGGTVSNDSFDSQPSPFAVGISQGRVINSIRSSDCFARFANDARGTWAANNCWLVSDRQSGLHWAQTRYTNGSGSRVWLMTICAVQQGEELLVEYGTGYWSVASRASRVGKEEGEDEEEDEEEKEEQNLRSRRFVCSDVDR